MPSKYANRTARERAVKRKDLNRTVGTMLSENSKTGASINLPLINCKPTKRCSNECYACVGPIANPNSVRKSMIVDKAIREMDLHRLIRECTQRLNVRLNGSGDLLPEHVRAILALARACIDTTFWGFTRNIEVAEALNGKLSNLSLIVSIDATSPKGFADGFDGPLAFGPRNPGDELPDDPRIIVVFPTHHQGKPDAAIPIDGKDCPATRFKVREEKLGACDRCKRCYQPHQFVGENNATFEV